MYLKFAVYKSANELLSKTRSDRLFHSLTLINRASLYVSSKTNSTKQISRIFGWSQSYFKILNETTRQWWLSSDNYSCIYLIPLSQQSVKTLENPNIDNKNSGGEIITAGIIIHANTIYINTQRHKLKRQLPESLLVQEDPEKGVRENWYKTEREHFTGKVHIMKANCTELGQNKMYEYSLFWPSQLSDTERACLFKKW